MRITDLKTFIVHAYRTNWVFVKLYTDAGIDGVGEGTVEMWEQTVATAIEELGRYIIGKDPFAVEQHVALMHRDSYWRSGVILRSAISAIEAALLDIKGKALGVPVYELLGGKCRDRVRAYGNGWFAGASTGSEFAEKAEQAVEIGFTALKWDPFGTAYMNLSPQELARAEAIVKHVRDRVGDETDLIIEAHGRFNVPTAVRVGQVLAPYNPLWYEEPLPPESVDALADMRARVTIPIATGERFYERFRFEELLIRKAADIVQPDVSHAGGLLECQKIAALAESHYVPMCPHNPSGPVAMAMTLHLAAATPNFYLLEMMVTDVPWRHQVVRESLEFVDGHVVISDAPGLGVELDEEAAQQFPYEPRDLRHYKGTLTHIRPVDAVPYYRVS